MGTIVRRSTRELFKPLFCKGHLVFIRSIDITSKSYLTKEFVVKIMINNLHEDLYKNCEQLCYSIKKYLDYNRICKIKYISSASIKNKKSFYMVYMYCN